MGKAKIFKGMKIKIKLGIEDLEDKIMNIPYNSLDEFYEDNKYIHPLLLDTAKKDIEILEENLNLFEVVSCKPDGDINILLNFRKSLKGSNCYRNSRFLTLEEIDKSIKSGYVIAVKGLKEIDSIEELSRGV